MTAGARRRSEELTRRWPGGREAPPAEEHAARGPRRPPRSQPAALRRRARLWSRISRARPRPGRLPTRLNAPAAAAEGAAEREARGGRPTGGRRCLYAAGARRPTACHRGALRGAVGRRPRFVPEAPRGGSHGATTAYVAASWAAGRVRGRRRAGPADRRRPEAGLPVRPASGPVLPPRELGRLARSLERFVAHGRGPLRRVGVPGVPPVVVDATPWRLAVWPRESARRRCRRRRGVLVAAAPAGGETGPGRLSPGSFLGLWRREPCGLGTARRGVDGEGADPRWVSPLLPFPPSSFSLVLAHPLLSFFSSS